MKSQELIDFEEQIKAEDNKEWLYNVALIVFDQMRLVEIKEEAAKIDERMFKGDRANYALEVPALDDEEIHFAANVVKGKLRMLGEKLPKEEEDEPKEI